MTHHAQHPIPVDTARLTFVCVTDPRPRLVSKDTGEIKTDRNGLSPCWRMTNGQVSTRQRAPTAALIRQCSAMPHWLNGLRLTVCRPRWRAT